MLIEHLLCGEEGMHKVLNIVGNQGYQEDEQITYKTQLK